MSADKDNKNTTISSIDFSNFDAELENLVNVIAGMNSRKNVDNVDSIKYTQSETNGYKKVNFENENNTNNCINRKKGRVIKKLDLQKVREAIEEATELKKKHNGKKKNT